MRPLRLTIVALSAVAALLGCAEKPDVSPPTVAKAAPAIQWFAGDVNAAFAEAARSGKPVFLYWGAAWCPPCHELKATVFSRPEFIEKLKLFVPVYVDGDAPGAQKLGDEFEVSGYPSVVVLRADRTEIARINGGMDLSQYAEVLDLVLGDVKPVSEMLAATQGVALSRDECRRLAYNGWEISGSPQQLQELADKLQRAALSCAAAGAVERGRLVAFGAAAASDAEEARIDKGAAASARLATHVKAVNALLADQEAALGAADALQYLGKSFFKAAMQVLPEAGAELRVRWSAVMDKAATDARFAEADQLSAIGMKLRAIDVMTAGHVSPEEAAAARQRVDAALARGQTGYARAGVVNSALFVLDTLGDDERVYAVAEAEMKASKYPFYYMLDLAGIEEDRGHHAEALVWFERAYRESQGAATRFQWGTEYALAVLRMQPDDEARIREVTLAVLGELDGPDRIHRRTTRRLEKLGSKLVDWSHGGRHKDVVKVLRQRRDALCAGIAAGDPARRNCEQFLL